MAVDKWNGLRQLHCGVTAVMICTFFTMFLKPVFDYWNLSVIEICYCCVAVLSVACLVATESQGDSYFVCLPTHPLPEKVDHG